MLAAAAESMLACLRIPWAFQPACCFLHCKLLLFLHCCEQQLAHPQIILSTCPAGPITGDLLDTAFAALFEANLTSLVTWLDVSFRYTVLLGQRMPEHSGLHRGRCAVVIVPPCMCPPW